MTNKCHKKRQARKRLSPRRGRTIKSAVDRRRTDEVGAHGAVNAHSPIPSKKQRPPQPEPSAQAQMVTPPRSRRGDPRTDQQPTGSPDKRNMYRASRAQFNPFAGCRYGCKYCGPSFQAQAKRQKRRCLSCHAFEPHEHPERLEKTLPQTGFGEFVFTCASGDVAFCKTKYLERIAERMRNDPTRTFLIQSKNPATFARVKWPSNVVLGTTIETNQDASCRAISKAPPPSRRLLDFLAIDHRSKMVTIEPVMAFDMDVMVDWMGKLNPCLIWLGFDTKGCGLPEPTMEQVRELHWRLSLLGIPVRLKELRTAAV